MARVPRWPIPGGDIGLSKERYEAIMGVILKAVTDEREECARAAETCTGGVAGTDPADGLSDFCCGYYDARRHIAAKIRARE